MAHHECAVRIQLSDAVSHAVQRVYKAKSDQQQASKGRKDLGPLIVELAVARLAERNTVKELDAHRLEHGC